MIKTKGKMFFRKKSSENKDQKNEKKSYFPSISRFIPAVSTKLIIIFIISLLLLAAVVREGMIVQGQFKTMQIAEQKRETLLSDIAYWQSIVAKRTDYRDGYFQLAVLEYQLGDKQKASAYVQKTLTLDPNFTEGRKLERVLNNK